MLDIRDQKWLDWLKDVDHFSFGYLSCFSDDHDICLAHALKNYWSNMTVTIERDDKIVGRINQFGIGGFNFGSGLYCNLKVAKELEKNFPQWADYLKALVEFWINKTPSSQIRLPEDEKFLNGQNVYWAGWGGHAILGFDDILSGGIDYIRKKLSLYNENESDPYKRSYREALYIVCDAIESFACNYSKKAAIMAENESDDKRRAELVEIAERCSHVPKYGARNFPEALQSFWFIHLLDDADSPGRFDQYIYPYYSRDIEKGIMSKDEAQKWIDHLWKRFNDTRSWNLCVGGLRPDGKDGTNDITFMALEATQRIKKVAPNLSLRLHKNSPHELWLKAIEVIETGVGMPALYNDDIIIPALIRYGISEEDARDYAMNGCSQVDIQGRSHMGLEDGEINLLKCLELALHDGFDPYTKRKIGPNTGDPRKFDNYDQFWQAYKKQVEALTKRLIDAANECQKAHAKTSPNLFRSLFIKGCIEKGIDFKSGGAEYNHGQILTQGIANTIDSLAIIKKLVFEDKHISMSELLYALDNNFPEESLRMTLINKVPKFGNDNEYVDSIAYQVIEHFFNHLNGYRTWRGGIYGGGSIVFTRAVSFGSKVGATPDGRKAFTPLADSIGPFQGRDLNGPTAIFISCAKIPQVLAQSAYVLNIKFTPKLINENKDKMVALLKTYFHQGGQQVQINIVDKKTLIEAKLHPELYKGLIVRVGGYSEYFNRLSQAHKDDIISRTEHIF